MTVWTLVDVGGLLVPRGAGEDELNHWDFEGRGFESLTLHHIQNQALTWRQSSTVATGLRSVVPVGATAGP